MDIENLNNAQEMLADNDAAVLSDLLQWMTDSDNALAALIERLPNRRPSETSMLINKIRASLSYPRITEVPLLLNQYQAPAESNSTTPPQPVAPNPA